MDKALTLHATDFIPSPPSKRWHKVVARVASVVVLVGVIVWAALHLNWSELAAAFVAGNWWLIGAAVIANIVTMSMQAWRWKLLLKSLGPVHFAQSFRALVIGFAMSSLLPAKAGELARVHMASRSMGVARGAIAGTTVLDHALNGLMFVPIMAIVPFLMPLPSWLAKGLIVVPAVALIIGVAGWLLAKPGAHHGTHESRLRHFVAHIRHGLGPVRSPRTILGAAGAAAIVWCCEFLTTWLALSAFIPHPGFAPTVLVLTAVTLAIAIPAPPGNIGTFEAGAVLALAAMGVPKERAVAFALAFHGVHLVSVWLSTLPAYLWRRVATA
jgi:uncharacterized membrane protein YbhN (UPF0104 family)